MARASAASQRLAFGTSREDPYGENSDDIHAFIRIGEHPPDCGVSDAKWGANGRIMTTGWVRPYDPAVVGGLNVDTTFNVGDTYITEVGPSLKGKRVAEIQCGYTKGVKACGKWFIVTVRDFWGKPPQGRKNYIARPCPYCFRASLLPDKPTGKS